MQSVPSGIPPTLLPAGEIAVRPLDQRAAVLAVLAHAQLPLGVRQALVALASCERETARALKCDSAITVVRM